MPTIYFAPSLPGVNLTSSNEFDGTGDLDIISNTATKISFQDGTDVLSFVGTGLTYETFMGQVVDITAGTITAINIKNGSTVNMNWTGLDVSAHTLLSHILDENWPALNTLMFSTGDTYRMTNNADAVKAFGGNDIVNGNDGNDRIWGGAGRDQLNGGRGNDKLYGEAGNDKLSGGVGLDSLTGGGGNDQFIFTISGPTNKKTITDFTSGADKLVFDNAVFTGLATNGALSADALAFGVKAADASDRFVYDQATGSLWYDRDGKGGSGQTLIADLQDGAALVAGDFLII